MSEFINILEEKHSTEESRKKAESLFSEKFREYLTKKKFSKTEDFQKKGTEGSLTLSRDYSASSGETTTSDSSRKSGRKLRKKLKGKPSHWDFHYAFRNKLTQCSLLKSNEGVAPPEDLKPLLLNMTILLQDLKQSPSEYENLYNLISKITILVTEFIRRPLKKTIHEGAGEHSKRVEKTVEMILNLLHEYKNGPNLDADNRIREYKRMEKEVTNQNQKIADVKKKLTEGEKPWGFDTRTKDPLQRVRNSILANEKLKSDIKFNHSHVKKYKKILLDREWTKHKLETELAHLKKRISKADLAEGETIDKQPEFSEPSVKSDHSHLSSQRIKNKNVRIKKDKKPRSLFN